MTNQRNDNWVDTEEIIFNFDNSFARELAGLFALLATLGFFGITTAQAGDWTTYKPGVVKAAVASGEPALLFYRTTW